MSLGRAHRWHCVASLTALWPRQELVVGDTRIHTLNILFGGLYWSPNPQLISGISRNVLFLERPVPALWLKHSRVTGRGLCILEKEAMRLQHPPALPCCWLNQWAAIWVLGLFCLVWPFSTCHPPFFHLKAPKSCASVYLTAPLTSIQSLWCCRTGLIIMRAFQLQQDNWKLDFSFCPVLWDLLQLSYRMCWWIIVMLMLVV